METKGRGLGRGAGDELIELEVNLTSSHNSMEKFLKAGEERLAAQGTLRCWETEAGGDKEDLSEYF